MEIEVQKYIGDLIKERRKLLQINQELVEGIIQSKILKP